MCRQSDIRRMEELLFILLVFDFEIPVPSHRRRYAFSYSLDSTVTECGNHENTAALPSVGRVSGRRERHKNRPALAGISTVASRFFGAGEMYCCRVASPKSSQCYGEKLVSTKPSRGHQSPLKTRSEVGPLHEVDGVGRMVRTPSARGLRQGSAPASAQSRWPQMGPGRGSPRARIRSYVRRQWQAPGGLSHPMPGVSGVALRRVRGR
jgi:hypothetical protein